MYKRKTLGGLCVGGIKRWTLSSAGSEMGPKPFRAQLKKNMIPYTKASLPGKQGEPVKSQTVKPPINAVSTKGERTRPYKRGFNPSLLVYHRSRHGVTLLKFLHCEHCNSVGDKPRQEGNYPEPNSEQ